MPETPVEPAELVSRWIESFNQRNLDGMLACMSDTVRFYPLRLSGLDRYYRGHDGVRDWFAQVQERGHAHQIVVLKLRAESDGEVVAVGELRLEEDPEPTRFWARDQVEDGKIVVVHHYLTDPDVFDDIARPKRPSRFPGLR